MLNNKQFEKMLAKLKRLADMVSLRMFVPVDTLRMSAYQTDSPLDAPPDAALYTPMKQGDTWGGEGAYLWLRGAYTVPEAHAEQPLYLMPVLGGYEGLLWVDGKPYGTFATKIVVTGHGNHYCDLMAANPSAGQVLDIDLEYYAGHKVRGCAPFRPYTLSNFEFTYESVTVCVKDELAAGFYFDLRTVLELYEALDEQSFRKASLLAALVDLHECVYYDPDGVEASVFDDALRRGREILAHVLADENGPSAPGVGIIGHSHMDTAWLWHLDETVKKCARTYANQLSLMDQYPEYLFIQSSAYHLEIVRRHYPELFERIKARILEGRYEPNGGVWVECDCNIPSGESMLRQFLWGQRYTREHFGYTADCFWLPDTFGYSASIPQLMKGSEVDYFLTTKIAWNDTTQFPLDTFYWQGIDDTSVFTHLNKTHVWPSPKDIYGVVHDAHHSDGIRQKHVTNRKLIAYGYGDGGGGPQFEMIEMARRIRNLEGCPRAEHTTVSGFMHDLEASVQRPSAYRGELYLELHRGTLTNQHEIKRNNRLAEAALHNLEYLTVAQAMREGKPASDSAYRPLQETLLVNQFHDILPGTSIPRVHAESKAAMQGVIREAGEQITALLSAASDGDAQTITIHNPMGFARADVVYLDNVPDGTWVQADVQLRQQRIQQQDGTTKLAVDGVAVDAYASVAVRLSPEHAEQASPFRREGNRLETPYAVIHFDDRMAFESFYDKRAQRELRGEGYALNTFLFAEDVPAMWDNWDVDADIQLKLRDTAELIGSRVVSDGAVEYRLRNEYRLSPVTTLTQDVVFYAGSPLVRFETVCAWQDDHRFLKTAFDTSIQCDFARHEVQFGNVKRPTTRNNATEQAKFEVSNHRYTDLSETRFGVALLNDCKYGISVSGGQMRLSLHKGGCRPDDTGDKGIHAFTYAFLPHACGFESEAVVAPAYACNTPHLISRGSDRRASMASTDRPNVVVETIKPCEDAQNALILRLYEAEGTHTHATLSLGFAPKAAYLTNMLEDEKAPLEASTAIPLTFHPFEIKTVKLTY